MALIFQSMKNLKLYNIFKTEIGLFSKYNFQNESEFSFSYNHISEKGSFLGIPIGKTESN